MLAALFVVLALVLVFVRNVQERRIIDRQRMERRKK